MTKLIVLLPVISILIYKPVNIQQTLSPHIAVPALEELTHFFAGHMDELDPAALLGVSISFGLLNQLQTVSSRFHSLCVKLAFLKRKINYIFEKENNDFFYAIISKKLILDDGKIFFFSFKSNERESFSVISGVKSAEDFEIGSPTPFESDFCLAELLTKKFCSAYCKQVMSVNRESSDYRLTHKLLYFIIVKRLKICEMLQADLNSSLILICSIIMSEIRWFFKVQTLDESLRDLFLEQLVLCGYSGFVREFFKDEWIRMVLNWRTIDGTFITSTEHSFDSHFNGLAAAFLSVVITKDNFY